MRLFQNSALASSYLVRLNQLVPNASGFEQRRRIFLDDRFGALHFLQPVLDGDADAFFTNGNDEIMQCQWGRENGMGAKASLEDILLAQIEHHRTEVFYNLDPVGYPSRFVRRLPGCVRQTLCWRAAPSGQADLTTYGAVLGNFPSILDSWRRKGCRAELFFPAVDPLMSTYGLGERPIDVLFVGGYSRHHSARAKILEGVASLDENPAGRVLPRCLAADPARGKPGRPPVAVVEAPSSCCHRQNLPGAGIRTRTLRSDWKVKDRAERCHRYGRSGSGQHALF